MLVFLQGQDEHGLYGLIGNGYLAEKIPFHGVGDLLLKLDRICDWIGTPHRVVDPRIFDNKMMQDLEEQQAQHPEVSKKNLYVNMNMDAYVEAVQAKEIIVVCIEFRQNASLQGRVTGKITGEQGVSFRSALELMRMLSMIKL